MAPRLHMLWQFLDNENGVIFVSINDIELFRLGLLLNEIFGEENHIGTIIWNGSDDNNPTRIAIEHEYILCYARNKSKLTPVWTGRSSDAKDLMLEEYDRLREIYSDPADIQKHLRRFIKQNKEVLGNLTHYNSVDDKGIYTGSRKVHNPGRNGYFYEVIHDITHKPCTTPARGYRYPQEAMQKLINEGKVIFGKDENQIVQIKVYLTEANTGLKSVINTINSRSGANELAALFDGDRTLFRNPKPVELIEYLLDFATSSSSIVLDAFGGSGTTAHAVLKLNQQDEGQRRFIIIEEGNGKDKYCSSLTAERVKRAIKKYGFKGGFQYLKAGKKLDRKAILNMKRTSMANLICQSDETGRGRGIARLNGNKYVIGKNHRNEAFCLVWEGEENEVTQEHLMEAAKEVTALGLKRPFRIYGTFCRIQDNSSFTFKQIPDEILLAMHISDDLEEDAVA